MGFYQLERCAGLNLKRRLGEREKERERALKQVCKQRWRLSGMELECSVLVRSPSSRERTGRDRLEEVFLAFLNLLSLHSLTLVFIYSLTGPNVLVMAPCVIVWMWLAGEEGNCS